MDRHTGRDRDREANRDKWRERETDRQTVTDQQRQTETDSWTDSLSKNLLFSAFDASSYVVTQPASYSTVFQSVEICIQ